MSIYKELIYFLKFFFWCFIATRGVLLVLLSIILILGICFSFAEEIKLGDAMYFAFITALAIGYGDIVPYTGIGKVISIMIGFLGIIFFGVVVGIAILAVKKATRFYLKKDDEWTY